MGGSRLGQSVLKVKDGQTREESSGRTGWEELCQKVSGTREQAADLGLMVVQNGKAQVEVETTPAAAVSAWHGGQAMRCSRQGQGQHDVFQKQIMMDILGAPTRQGSRGCNRGCKIAEARQRKMSVESLVIVDRILLQVIGFISLLWHTPLQIKLQWRVATSVVRKEIWIFWKLDGQGIRIQTRKDANVP